MVNDPYEHVPISYEAVTFFGGCRLLMKMMIFEKNQLKFSLLSMVYDPYEHVPISYGAVTFFGGYRLLMKMMIFIKNPLSFSS